MMQDMQPVEPLVVSVNDAAIMLGVNHQAVRRMINKREIPERKVVRIGGQLRINKRFLLTLAREDVEEAK